MKFLNDYTFSPLVVVRTPVYSYANYDSSGRVLSRLLNDPLFRQAIFLASTSLFRELQLAEFNVEKLKPKVSIALRKYYNRMSFRCTPFGLFSALSTVRWGHGQPLILCDVLQPRGYFSYGYISGKTQRLLSTPLHEHLTYLINETVYTVNDSIRYIRYEDDETTGRRKFHLHEMQVNAVLTAIIGYCKTKRTRKAITQFISRAFNANEQDSECYVEEIISRQLLVCSFQPHVLDKEYLVGASGAINWAEEMASDMKAPVNEGRSKYYVSLHKPLESGQLNTDYQEQIKDGLYCINRLLKMPPHEGLQDFKAAFKKKFDRQTISLLYALDPEVGVGYEKLASAEASSILLRDVHFTQHAIAKGNLLEWTKGHALLMRKWSQFEKSNRLTSLHITAQDLEELPVQDDSPAAPNSISVMFRVLDGTVCMESSGGVSATALSGRFTLFDNDILNAALTIVRQTEAANQAVVFAEITHFCDRHTANIERRKSLWSYEIPVLTGSALPEEQQIPLADLYVTIADEQIILWSKRLHKRVIPVLSSAFNYLRNDLSIFRFLCDLQHQQLGTNLTFGLEYFFPNLDYYPRVTYKNTIIALATWHLKVEHLKAVLHDTRDVQLKVIKKWVAASLMPRFISINAHDNQLVFDTANEEDLLFFMENIRNEATVTIKEFPFCAEKAALITGPANEKYSHQLIASLVHFNEVYSPLELTEGTPAGDSQRKYIPGSEWLYCKIYCHPARANELLLEHIAGYVGELQKQNILIQWFFIRYNDPAYHLRVRLQIVQESIGETVSVLKQWFDELILSGIVSDFGVGIYERELERYGSKTIEDIEKWFCASSDLVIDNLKNASEGEGTYRFFESAFGAIDNMCGVFEWSINDRIGVFKELYEALSVTFDRSAAKNEQLKKKYRDVNSNIILPLPGSSLAGKTSQNNCEVYFEQQCKKVYLKLSARESADRVRLFADMVHMHLNRVFVDEARKQEMIVYYCLWKHYQSVKARNNISPGPVGS